jgi:streptogramin lyase
MGCADRPLDLPDDERLDLSRAPDSGRRPDLSIPDLGTTEDLSIVRTTPPDLAIEDLTSPPDLANADLLLPLLSEFPVPSKYGAGPIVSGSDGNLWFAETYAQKIGRITVEGVITEFALSARSYPNGVALGADGNVWFPEQGNAHVGRITPSGQVTEFALPPSTPTAICAGPDGNLWVTDTENAQVFRVTTAGAFTAFSTGVSGGTNTGSLLSIVPGPDGRLWIDLAAANEVVTVGVDGTLGPSYSVSNDDFYLFTRPGAVWVTNSYYGQITHVGGGGAIIPPATYQPTVAVTAPDQTVWFSAQHVDKTPAPDAIAESTPDGKSVTLHLLENYAGPAWITIGPDGNVWFAEVSANRIGRLRRDVRP